MKISVTKLLKMVLNKHNDKKHGHNQQFMQSYACFQLIVAESSRGRDDIV